MWWSDQSDCRCQIFHLPETGLEIQGTRVWIPVRSVSISPILFTMPFPVEVTETQHFDKNYKCILCKNDRVAINSLLHYMGSCFLYTGHSTDVQAIYKICRRGEEEEMRNLGLDNHKLLWHGSGTSNFISILHRGLLVAPTGIPITGHLFGEVRYNYLWDHLLVNLHVNW